MPTRIVMANGEHISVSPDIDAVAEQLKSGALTRFDRPWGDTPIYVNPSEVTYLEGHEERNPSMEAMEGMAEGAPAPAGGPAGGAGGGAPPGGPVGGPGQAHPGGPPNPP